MTFPFVATLATLPRECSLSAAVTDLPAVNLSQASIVQEHLASIVRGMLMPLHAHLVATNVIQKQFVPTNMNISQRGVNACMHCMHAIERSIQTAGENGVRVGEILNNAAKREWVSPCSPLQDSVHMGTGGSIQDDENFETPADLSLIHISEPTRPY